MNEDGSETLYSFEVDQPIVNFGVSVIGASAGALIDPFILGSKDENDVQGYACDPDRRELADLRREPRRRRGRRAVPAAAAVLRRRRLARRRVHESLAEGPVRPQGLGRRLVGPAVRILTTRVTAGRPLIAAVAVDPQSGVDPLSLVINYNNALVGASAYDPVSGLILFGIPAAAPPFKAGKTNLILQASDYQETKNINTVGDAIYPNSTFAQKKISVVAGPTVSWLAPPANVCAAKTEQLRRDRRRGEEGQAGRVRARREADRRRQVRPARALLLHVEDGQGGEGQSPARRDAHRRERHDRSVSAQDQRSASSGRHRRLLRDRSGGGEGAPAPRNSSSSGSRVRRRRRTSTRPATSPTAKRFRRSPRASSNATRASTCSSTTPASPVARTTSTPTPERIELVIDVNYLGSIWTTLAFLPGLQAGSHVVNVVSVAGIVRRGALFRVEARTARVLTVDRGGARAARREGARRPPRPDRDARLPAAPPYARPLYRFVARPSLVAQRLLDAVDHDRREIYVPRWYRPAAWLRGARAPASSRPCEDVPAEHALVARRCQAFRPLAVETLATGEIEVGLEIPRLADDLLAVQHEPVRVEEGAQVSSASTRVVDGSRARSKRFSSKASSGSTGASWSTTRIARPAA